MGCHDPVIPILLYIYLGIMPDFFFLYKRTRGFRYFPLRILPLFSPILTILTTFSSNLMKIMGLGTLPRGLWPLPPRFDQIELLGSLLTPKSSFLTPPANIFFNFWWFCSIAALFLPDPQKKVIKIDFLAKICKNSRAPPGKTEKPEKLNGVFSMKNRHFFRKFMEKGVRGPKMRVLGSKRPKSGSKWSKMTLWQWFLMS